MKETEDANKWKGVPCSWIVQNIVNTFIPLRADYRFIAIPIKVPMGFSTEIEINNLKISWNHENFCLSNKHPSMLMWMLVQGLLLVPRTRLFFPKGHSVDLMHIFIKEERYVLSFVCYKIF